MRGFRSAASATRFCTAYEEIRQYFRLTTANPKTLSLAHQREHLRQRCVDLFAAWQAA